MPRDLNASTAKLFAGSSNGQLLLQQLEENSRNVGTDPAVGSAVGLAYNLSSSRCSTHGTHVSVMCAAAGACRVRLEDDRQRNNIVRRAAARRCPMAPCAAAAFRPGVCKCDDGWGGKQCSDEEQQHQPEQKGRRHAAALGKCKGANPCDHFRWWQYEWYSVDCSGRGVFHRFVGAHDTGCSAEGRSTCWSKSWCECPSRYYGSQCQFATTQTLSVTRSVSETGTHTKSKSLTETASIGVGGARKTVYRWGLPWEPLCCEENEKIYFAVHVLLPLVIVIVVFMVVFRFVSKKCDEMEKEKQQQQHQHRVDGPTLVLRNHHVVREMRPVYAVVEVGHLAAAAVEMDELLPKQGDVRAAAATLEDDGLGSDE